MGIKRQYEFQMVHTTSQDFKTAATIKDRFTLLTSILYVLVSMRAMLEGNLSTKMEGIVIAAHSDHRISTGSRFKPSLFNRVVFFKRCK